jgi:hypothetical protein
MDHPESSDEESFSDEELAITGPEEPVVDSDDELHLGHPNENTLVPDLANAVPYSPTPFLGQDSPLPTPTTSARKTDEVVPLAVETIPQLGDYFVPYTPTGNAQQWLAHLAEFAELARVADRPGETPATESSTLREYQEAVIRDLRIFPAIALFWGTSAGKTHGATAYPEWLVGEYEAGRGPKPTFHVIARGSTILKEIRHQLVCHAPGGRYLPPEPAKGWATERAQRGAINRSLKRYYNFYPYGALASTLEAMSDAQIVQAYSHSVIWIDEAQNLRTQEDSKQDKERVYQQIWRLCHLPVDIKLILSGATPFLSSGQDFSSVVNLALPENRQIPGEFFGTLTQPRVPTLAELDYYIGGLVSYVRTPPLNLDRRYMTTLPAFHQSIEHRGHPVPCPAYATEMVGIQAQSYLVAHRQAGRLYNSVLQCSNFVFPDGSWGSGKSAEQRAQEKARRTGSRARQQARREEKQRIKRLERGEIPPEQEATVPTRRGPKPEQEKVVPRPTEQELGGIDERQHGFAK